MPTHPAILTELAVRYGRCDPDSPDDIDAFYIRKLGRLPRRARDRIGFEIHYRDGENPPRILSKVEVRQFDQWFKEDEREARHRAIRRPAFHLPRLSRSAVVIAGAVPLAIGASVLVWYIFPSLTPVLTLNGIIRAVPSIAH